MLLTVCTHFVKLTFQEVRCDVECFNLVSFQLETIPVPRQDFGQRTTLLWERIKSTISSQTDFLYRSIVFLLTWYRMFIVSFLLKIKQTNDFVLNKIQRKPFVFIFPQRFFIRMGIILEYFVERLRSENSTERKQPPPSTRSFQQKQLASR